MAVQVESQGQLQEFLAVLSRRRWQLVLPALFAIALGFSFAEIVPRKFVAKTRIELRETRPQSAEPGEAKQSPTAWEIYNAPHHIIHAGRIRRVIADELQWAEFTRLTAAKQDAYIERVKRNLKVTVLQKQREQGSTFVDVSYSDVDRNRAMDFLSRLAKLWVTEVIDRDRAVLKKEAELAQDRLAEAESAAQLARSNLDELLQRNDLPLFEPTGFTAGEARDKVDRAIETAQSERDEVQKALTELDAQVAKLEEQWAAMPAQVPVSEVMDGVSQEGLIAKLEMQIKALRAQQAPLKPAHSQYQVLEREVQELEEQLAAAQQLAREELTVTRNEPNPERPRLRAQIDELGVKRSGHTARLAELERQIASSRDLRKERIDLLSRRDRLRRDKLAADEELGRCERIYNDKRAALQTATEAYGNPFDVAQEAFAPLTPSEPNPWVIRGIALVVGLALGLGIALAAEYSRSCYRGVQDIARVMTVPVLGVVNRIVTTGELRRARLQRIATAASTCVLLGGITWFTWAWIAQRDLLPTKLSEAVDELLMTLR
jgi:succinoglycan biosynthesis transport protein ExoP